MIIGLTGAYCAGKGTVAEYLKTKGFYYTSLSDVIREFLTKTNTPITRDSLIARGNDLRNICGPSILADLILNKIEKDQGINYSIDSIRNQYEIGSLRKNPEFFLFNIDAPIDLRFKRMSSRTRNENDPKTLEDFVAHEAVENSINPLYQQIKECQKLADITITNDSKTEDLYPKIDAALNSLLPEITKRFKRPSWDESWVGVAKEVEKRSNCIKRKVGAVIVKDNNYISSGYNGTPRGTKNCYEGGCPRCNSFTKSGANYDECLCVHAEINAIEQSNKSERRDATMYVSLAPCLGCAKTIVNSGIKEIVYYREFPIAKITSKLLEEAGVKLRKFG